MKDLNMIVWLTQLGLSVAAPLAVFVLAAVWLRDRFGWGNWVILVGVGLGILSAAEGLRTSLKIMSRMGKKDDDPQPPPVAYNDHE